MAYETIATTSLYKGPIFELLQESVQLPNGRVARRDVLSMSGAAGVVPVMDDGRILLVRQYRQGVRRMMLEIPAGKLDPAEDPMTCALRELQEETGYRAEKIRPLCRISPSSSYTTEIIYLYLAEGLTPGDQHPDEDEFVTLEAYTLDAILQMIDNGDLIDGKTITAILLYARGK